MRRLVLALLLPACSSHADAQQSEDSGAVVETGAETGTPPTLAASARAIPGNAIGAIVDVITDTNASVSVDADGESTPPVIAGDSGKVSIAVLGLHQKSTAHLVVHAEKGGLVTQKELAFATGALPHDLPESFPPKVTSPGLGGYAWVGIASPPKMIDLDLVLDRKGRIVWYWEPSKYGLPGHFQRLNGHFLVSDPSVLGYRELDLFGESLATWTAAGSVFADFHDFVDLGAGHALMMAYDVEHTYDSTPWVPGGVPDAIRYDGTVEEVDAKGKVYFHFSTYGNIGPDEMIEDGSGWTKIDPKETDIVHLNAIDAGPDGDLLVSMRMTSSVIKVARKDGSVLYRMGGNKSDFTFVDDPMGGFSMQHDVRWVPGKSELFVLDNGNNHTPRVTRACRYAIDEKAKTARLIWSYTHDPPLFSAFAGSVRVLPNGNMQVVHAQQGLITEIEPETKKVVWELEIPGYFIYRSLFEAKLYP
ncbi:MAG: aryl-sulfate sulfotransferase [Polyangiales bacterium]